MWSREKWKWIKMWSLENLKWIKMYVSVPNAIQINKTANPSPIK